MSASAPAAPSQSRRLSVVECSLPEGVPVSVVNLPDGRVVVYTDSTQVNLTPEERRADREMARRLVPDLGPVLDELATYDA